MAQAYFRREAEKALRASEMFIETHRRKKGI